MKGFPPTHPGAILREDVLPALGTSKIEIAECLGITKAELEKVLSERASISPGIANGLGELCGNGAEFWLNLQAQYDDDQAMPGLHGESMNLLKSLWRHLFGDVKHVETDWSQADEDALDRARCPYCQLYSCYCHLRE